MEINIDADDVNKIIDLIEWRIDDMKMHLDILNRSPNAKRDLVDNLSYLLGQYDYLVIRLRDAL